MLAESIWARRALLAAAILFLCLLTRLVNTNLDRRPRKTKGRLSDREIKCIEFIESKECDGRGSKRFQDDSTSDSDSTIWMRCTDPTSGDHYYKNIAEGRVTWIAPEENYKTMDPDERSTKSDQIMTRMKTN